MSIYRTVRYQVFLMTLLVFVLSSNSTFAKEVFVKYRGLVNLEHFSCPNLKASSLVQALCYDDNEQYLLVSLNGTFYHYCEVPNSVYEAWLHATSLGKFYNFEIKGHYDCRINYLPSYEQ